MEAEARYTYVGLAVLLLVAALAGALVWLQNVGARERFANYAIHFEQQALDGLEVGADVKLRGIKVGRVEAYALADGSVERVRVVVRVDRHVPVTSQTVAVISRNYVTGLAAINLVHRGPGGEPVRAGAGDELPLIAEGRSDLDLITGRFSEVGELASDALDNVNRLLAQDNREALMDTLRALRELADGLSARMTTLEQTMRRVGNAATAIGAASTRMAAAGERLAAVGEDAGRRVTVAVEGAGAQVAAASGKLGDGLERTLAQADLALAEARGALAAIERQTVSSARRLEDAAASVDDRLAAATTELRSSVEAAAHVLDRLRDPRAALLGPAASQLGPGEAPP
ncbi:MAG: MlaD family protein [Gammaproteobacteria bacterium]